MTDTGYQLARAATGAVRRPRIMPAPDRRPGVIVSGAAGVPRRQARRKEVGAP
jgi:hypothetical protein